MLARLSVVVTVVLLMVLALAVRLNGLDWRDGDLSTDEARLALAAQGVLATGLPYLPSDRLYTRGLVTIYATAPSLGLFGVHDWSARLPGVVFGVLLVPAVFLLARVAGGTIPALAAAVLVVVCGPLIQWSRQAWPPAAFVLLFTLTAYAGYRGFVEDRPRWQVLAALGFLLTMLAYEMAMIWPAGVGLYLAGRAMRRDLGWWHGRPTLIAVGVAVLAVGLLAVLGLALRAGTLAGADSEFRHYFTPSLRLSGVGYYWRWVWSTSLPLALLAVAGGLWQRGGGRPVPPGLGYLGALLLVALLVPTFVIQDKQEQQYGLAVLPLAAALAAWGVAALTGADPHPLIAHHGAPRLRRLPTAPSPASRRGGTVRSRRLGVVLAAVLALAAFGAVLWPDIVRAAQPHTVSRAPTWLDDLRAKGWRPDDPQALVLAEAPLVTMLYLRRADFYVHPEGFERYAYQDGPVARSLYTPAVLLKQAGDFERLVAGPYAGRTLWIIGQDDRLPRLTRQMDPRLWERLQQVSGVTRPTRGWWLMRVELPPR